MENHKLCLMSGLLVETQPVVAKQRSSVGRVGLGKSWCSQQLLGFVPKSPFGDAGEKSEHLA